MTAKQFVAIRKAAQMTQQEMANYLRVDIRTVQRYEAAEIAIEGPVEKLCEILDAQNQERKPRK